MTRDEILHAINATWSDAANVIAPGTLSYGPSGFDGTQQPFGVRDRIADFGVLAAATRLRIKRLKFVRLGRGVPPVWWRRDTPAPREYPRFASSMMRWAAPLIEAERMRRERIENDPNTKMAVAEQKAAIREFWASASCFHCRSKPVTKGTVVDGRVLFHCDSHYPLSESQQRERREADRKEAERKLRRR